MRRAPRASPLQARSPRTFDDSARVAAAVAGAAWEYLSAAAGRSLAGPVSPLSDKLPDKLHIYRHQNNRRTDNCLQKLAKTNKLAAENVSIKNY